MAFGKSYRAAVVQGCAAASAMGSFRPPHNRLATKLAEEDKHKPDAIAGPREKPLRLSDVKSRCEGRIAADGCPRVAETSLARRQRRRSAMGQALLPVQYPDLSYTTVSVTFGVEV
jgi:hypothetical protein